MQCTVYRYEKPILAAREPGASDSELKRAQELQNELSTIVNEFMLKRGNILNAQHLPPKLVQFVCCNLTDLQRDIYDKLLSSKQLRHIREGRELNVLNSIRQLINICCHPRMLIDSYRAKVAKGEEDEELSSLVDSIPEVSMPSRGLKSLQHASEGRGPLRGAKSSTKQMSGGCDGYINPEESGKLFVLYRMMQTMRAMKEGERIVVVSNYTSALDLIEKMCMQNGWPWLRLDGTTTGQKRTKLVSEFNDPYSGAFAFLLSSKAGGIVETLVNYVS
jgi:DNA repair and recombination RAD54-like protein